MMDLTISTTEVAVTVASFGIVLVILGVFNLCSSRRLRALVNQEADLRRELDKADELGAVIQDDLRGAMRKLSYVRTYAAKISGTENTVYNKVVRELRGILDADSDECGKRG